MGKLLICLAGIWGFVISLAFAESPVPADWLADWNNPPAADRPLQMLHGADLSNPETAAYYRDQCGLGGVVINVGGPGYVRNEENWKRFVAGARNAADAGLRLWIYDEEGYPSLEAGGAVLEQVPELVSKELVWDENNQDEPFTVRDCYEFTHSCNNYSACRRYPNPLEPEAVDKFIEVTHQRYREEMGDELFKKVEAFFTDEPSMMAANLGQIPEEARQRVRIEDPLDPDKKNLPMLPWCSDLEDLYRERYGEELRPHFLSLFTGDTRRDKEIRARYWRLIEDLYAQRYFGAIQAWCRAAGGPVSSGHTLHEETLNGHVPLDGNKMRTLKSLDWPGLDNLNSDPGGSAYSAWLAAAFPCSAAQIIGSRRVMDEMSDFGQVNSGARLPVTLDWMESAAAWQMAWGVTDFTLYYQIRGGENAPYRNEETHHAYCDFVGRINSVLLPAKPVRPVLLYYPIETMQREFKPVAECVNNAPQSAEMTLAIESFVAIGTALTRAQIPFTVIDGESIAELDPERLAQWNAVILPQESAPPVEVLDRLARAWGEGLPEESPRFFFADREKPLDSAEAVSRALDAAARPRLKCEPGFDYLAQGVFQREGKLIVLLANVWGDPWEGTVQLASDRAVSNQVWGVMDPQTGEVGELEQNGGKARLRLDARQTLLLVIPFESEEGR
ncbi:MAG: hypothetical protein IJG60_00990 [Thermoguttaceae bacterium]|nr:hypothetical protein [Thermoguttaceae bacterium]